MKATKIFVLKLQQIIYTIIAIIIGISLILFLTSLFTKPSNEVTETMAYTPGVYTSSIYLDHQPIKVEVIVDADHINSIQLTDASDYTKALYPLLEPAMSNLESQIINTQSLHGITIDTTSQYTSELLITAIESALEKATNK